jgi:hypothetical protein
MIPRIKDPDTMRTFGLVFLLLANLAHWRLQPTPQFGQGPVDGAVGLLFGLAFGFLLLSLRRACRPRTPQAS